jgi:hypothetical protein
LQTIFYVVVSIVESKTGEIVIKMREKAVRLKRKKIGLTGFPRQIV